MFDRLKKWFVGWLHGGPHFIVGDPANPYLHRWYIIPRNDWCCIYLHKFLRDDDDRAMHDHPWYSLSFLLRGRYLEQMDTVSMFGEPGVGKRMRSWGWFFKGMGGFPIVFRRATHRHRVELLDGKPVWTLFITGPRVREWGFHCPGRWVHWKDFVDSTNTGNIGRGCGEQ